MLSAETDSSKAIANLELNIRVLKEQYDYTVSQLQQIRPGLPKDLGLYEGKLVGKYQLETQIRKQEHKLAALKSPNSEVASEFEMLTVTNVTPLKLMITFISDNPDVDQIEYFLYPEMELEVPAADVKALQVSDYRDDGIYPIYRVDTLKTDEMLSLKLDGGTYSTAAN